MRTNLMPAVVLLLLVLTSCNANIPQGKFKCATSDDCPSGWVCLKADQGKRCFASVDALDDAGAKPGSSESTGGKGGKPNNGTGGKGGVTDGGAGDGGKDAGPIPVGGPCAINADCDDADPCNGDELCADSVCAAGTPFECADLGDICLKNVCVGEAGVAKCEAQPDHEGQSCRDGDDSSDPQATCALDYQCVDGACEAQTTESCVDGQCEIGAGCDPVDGCVFAPFSASTVCDDGDSCTKTDLCSGTDGSCAGTAYSCDDSVACTVDTCDGAGACTNVAKDSLCGGPCKSGTCDLTAGCLNVTLSQDFVSCEDGKPATSSELCYRGECIGKTEGAPTASCEVGGCGCSGFGAVKDLEYSGTTYAGLVEATQTGTGPCTAGTVSIVYDVTPTALTPYTTDTMNGAISETSTDLSGGYVISSAHVGQRNTTDFSVDWLNTVVGDAVAAGTPALQAFRGLARHTSGAILGDSTNHIWLWGSDTTTASTARVVSCRSCSSISVGGCNTPLACAYSSTYASSTIAGITPYTQGGFTATYGGSIALVNLPTGATRRQIFEDGSNKDFFTSTLKVNESTGAWSGSLRLSGAGQVLAYGSGTNNLQLCNDPEYDGIAVCTPITGLPNQNVRTYLRAVLGFSTTAVMMLANNGSSYYLELLPAGLDPATGSNWTEILIANSGGTVPVAIASSPDGFMLFGKSGSVPYIWSWKP